MGDEGFGGRATGDGVHHRGFDFEEIARFEEAADVADDFAADDEGVAAVFVGDEVNVALAVACFLVGEAVVFFRQGAQRFGEQFEVCGVDGEFAGLGAEQFAARADDVAHVPGFEVGVAAFRQFVAAEVDLHARAAAVLDGGEARLAHDALAHHASRDADFARRQQLVGVFDAVVCGVQGGGFVRRAGVVGEGDAARADGGEFLSPFGDEFVFVGGLGSHTSTPCFRLAWRKGSSPPSRTAWVLLVS